jgi:hypothetical protein
MKQNFGRLLGVPAPIDFGALKERLRIDQAKTAAGKANERHQTRGQVPNTAVEALTALCTDKASSKIASQSLRGAFAPETADWLEDKDL